METTINGVPAHPLWVHAVVVLVPLSALALVLCAAWPVVMRRAGIGLPLLALAALVSVPLATDAGEWLAEQVPETAAVERHTEMGDDLLPWVVAIFVLAVLLWLLHGGLLRRFLPSGAGGADRADRADGAGRAGGATGPGGVPTAGGGPASGGGHGTGGASGAAGRLAVSRAVLVVGTVLALVAGVGAVVQVYRIGDSGAKSVWQGF
ncbi:hypothetical protein ACF09K_28810 [Streptomyces sp. NPDC014882]|uniref:hypothetical protein n=1 Tax=Streptomyces sp. NPDC014882 TaxID=3364927 RepID=UPI0036FD63BB